MTTEQLFSVSGLTVLPIWALMVMAPRWRATRRLLSSSLVLVAPALLYAALVVPDLGAILPAVMLPRLDQISTLLGQPRGTTIAWVHFLAFDLFVGRWIYLDSGRRGLSPWLVSPLLLLTLLLGPLGLLSYLALRAQIVRHWAQRARVLIHRSGIMDQPGSRALALTALGAGLLMVASLFMQLVDARLVGGASVWAKPAKFGASVALGALAMALIVRRLPTGRGLQRASLLMAAMLCLELTLIVMQAVRGVHSHFNARTTFDYAVFQAMGAGISVFWGAQAYVTWRAFRHPFSSPALARGIRMGLLIAVIGGALGFIMPIPTTAQRASMASGETTTAIGAHAVGVPDGGPGMPLTRWSTSGGDLRVPHFVGLHALQLLPLLGWALSRRRQRRADELVLFAGLAYLGLVLTTLIQALRGQPLLSPDAITALLGAGTLVLAALLTVLLRRPFGFRVLRWRASPS